MKQAVTLLICCLMLALGTEGKGTDLLPLSAIDSNWKSERIPVNTSDGTADVMTLLKAFNTAWPTEAVQSIINVTGDKRLYQHDAMTMPPGCHGSVFVDIDDFNCAYFHPTNEATQSVEARAYQCDNGHMVFCISFEDTGKQPQPFCCFYDYDPDIRMMIPDQEPYSNLKRKWADSEFHYLLRLGYDQTIIVQEISPNGENRYHYYVFTGMCHAYDHSGESPYDDMDEEEDEVMLPEDAVLKDEDDNRELYVNVDGVGSEMGQWSVWLRDKNTGMVTYVFATENTVEPRWSKMQDGNGIAVSIDEIAAGECYTALLIPWDADKIFVEGCPDARNVWSYVIDVKTKQAIQFPTNEGMIAIDPSKQEFHMSNYHYLPEGGRYSMERVYTIDGQFTGTEYRIAD